jgi:hypothetical protein
VVATSSGLMRQRLRGQLRWAWLTAETADFVSEEVLVRRGSSVRRTRNVLAGFLLAVTPLVFGQEPPLTPQFPEDAFGARQLIAWSRLQKPQPAPQPMPPQDTPVPEPGQPGNQPADPQTPSQPTPRTQAFTGKILKDGNKYVLKVASNITFELQDQGDLQQADLPPYENQTVRVIGSLDTGSNTIRIVKIELLS